ncbi:T9SS type A sorting domain-containing protein [Neolewinella antarctica]|uniref:Secretion system C-terminal sorting domain-containing protein n=1 Tax=Neolewinella antarctica TaxID=442734 RepID=A0ABX0XC02_9BACT|nr:T9SS type A sorting domain-containing protein [Neolewinella antarctica]NJC26727.1 hypothetical protein [Neolewinella antarctica]
MKHLFTLLLLLPCLLVGQTQIGMAISGATERIESGQSVSLSADGSRVAIGAPGNTNNGNDTGSQGQLEIYQQTASGSWTRIFFISGLATGDQFGRSVSLSADGTRVAVGSPFSDVNGNNAGRVQIFTEIGPGSWRPLGQPILGESAIDLSGFSVSLSADGNRVAIGAYLNDAGGSTGGDRGHVRVYQAPATMSGTWTQFGVDIDGTVDNGFFGVSVSLSDDGSRVAVGAERGNGTVNGAGSVRVFEEPAAVSGNWAQVGPTLDGQAFNDRFGRSVSLSGDGSRVAVGAPNARGAVQSGVVEVYDYASGGSIGTWTQVGADITGEAFGDRFGNSVSLSGADGNRLAVGAPTNDGTGTDAGHAQIYDFQGGTWMQFGSDIDGQTADDRSGTSVALAADGSTLATGAPFNDNNGENAGEVRIYDLGAVVLPVELISFTAAANKKSVVLDWLTASETDNAFFDLEHSPDGSEWAEVGTVMSDGDGESEQAYRFEHRQPVTGVNYYRLNQTDFDGTSTRSDVISVTFGVAEERVSVYPNPSPGGLINISLSEGVQVSSVRLLSMEGKLIHMLAGTTRSINLTGLPAAIYLLQVVTPQGILRERVVVR